MKRAIHEHWPLMASISLVWLTLGIVLILSLWQNQGRLVYDIDDPYIHMAIAKNLVRHGVWGVTRYEFSSSASSVLWPLLISATYLMFGVNEPSPLILNVLLATALIVFGYVLLKQFKPSLPAPYIFGVLLGTAAVTPLPALAFTGMEHVLHLLITMLFVHLSAQILSTDASPSRRKAQLLLLLSPLLTLTRWEGAFAVSVVCVLFLLRKRWLYGFTLGLAALIPVAGYGAVSAAHGWYVFPNSILLNSNVPNLAPSLLDLLGRSLYRGLVASPHIEVLTLLALSLYWLRYESERGMWEYGQLLLAMFIGITLLHVQFVGPVRWFYRHDAYVVGLGMWTIAATCFEYLGRRLRRIQMDWDRIPRSLALCVLALFLVLPIVKRGVVSFAQRAHSTFQVPRATTNIHEQQYQMGLFLQQFYTGEGVAANDIGAINYLADIRCLDLIGLASLEVARLKRGANWNGRQIANLAQSQGTRVAIIYDSWFDWGPVHNIPSEWTRVGQWTITRNVVAGSDTVSFYAVDASEETRLIAHLRQFATQLPVTVRQSGRYIESLRRAEPS